MGFRAFDAFAKPVDGLRTKTIVGGVITVIAASAAAILFLSQIYLYIRVDTRQNFHITESISQPIPTRRAVHSARGPGIKNHIPINVRITFPFVKCRDLDYAHDDAKGNQIHAVSGGGNMQLKKDIPTGDELVESGFYSPGIKFPDGCTIHGNIKVPPVGGTLAFMISGQAWMEMVQYLSLGIRDPRKYGDGDAPHMFNVSHYIHALDFGTPFPLSTNPLSKSRHVFDEETGTGVSNIIVKIIDTHYKRPGRFKRKHHQVSITQNIIGQSYLATASTGMLPGIAIAYDFSPLSVHHTEERENILLFLSSLVSIVGGVFVTVRLVSSLFVGVADLAKKLD